MGKQTIEQGVGDFAFADEWGPEYVVRVYDAAAGMRGILVIDNTALGLGKGGVRMTPNITEEEVFRLARTMTWKNALADIPFGGAKAGIVFDPKTDAPKKREIVQAFARAIKPFVPRKYVAGPDVNTGEKDMQHFVEAIGNWRGATGKPANYCMTSFGKQGEKCGIPHEFGSTGFGVAQATKVAADVAGIRIAGATVAIHGFGNVGTFAYQYLTEMGAKVVAIADKTGAAYDSRGLSSDRIAPLIKQNKPITECGGKCDYVSTDEFWKIPVDILIPASVTDVINNSNKQGIKAKVIVEAGNIPMREHIEEEFSKKGTLIVPDFVANAGGVISSYAEYRGYNPKRMFNLVERKITATTERVLNESVRQRRGTRAVAVSLAQAKVRRAMAGKERR